MPANVWLVVWWLATTLQSCSSFLLQHKFAPSVAALCRSSASTPGPAEYSYEEEGVFDDEFDVFDDDLELGPIVFDDHPTNSTGTSSSPLTLDQLSATFVGGRANVSYFYLKNELGLSDDAMWRITYDASSALAMKTQVIRDKVELLRRTMHLSDGDVRSILEMQPTILHLSAERNIGPTLLFLLRSLDLGRDELRRLVVASPCILCYSVSNLKTKIGFFATVLEYSVPECRDLFLREPGLLRASVTKGLGPHVQFLANEMELDLPQLQTLVQKNPKILLYSLEKNLIPKLIYYLLMKLNMSPSQAQKMLLSYPPFVDYNLERVIWPTTHYFVHDLGFAVTQFRSILLKFPRLVSHSLRKIKYAVGFFRFELGLSAEQVQRVLSGAPTILGLNVEENIKVKVNYLQDALALDAEQLRALLVAIPTVLGLNPKANVEPKIEFLRQHFSSQEELRDAVLRMPALLIYSLNNRIQPRMISILDGGIDAYAITAAIPLKEDDFETWLQRRIEKMQPVPVPSDVEIDSSVLEVTPLQTLASDRITHWTRERRPR